MKLNSVTRHIVNKLLQMNTCKAYLYLNSMGFEKIGFGSESTVFSKKGFEFVIKIQRYQCIKHVPCDKHFANQVFFTGDKFNVIVQEKCEKFPYIYNKEGTPEYKRWEKFATFLYNKFNVLDTQDFNMGLKNGRLVSIDWNH